MKILLLFFIFCFPSSADAAGAPQWHELKGEHFFVYYEQDKNFAADVLRRSEEYYRSIASELGYQRYSGFWTWDNRVKIYIYPDKKSFLEASGQNEWSEGMADYTNKTIISYVWNQGFLDALLPHEVTHLIFRDFVGIEGDIPLWLDEGVAQWMEPQKRGLLQAAMGDLMQTNRVLPLEKMMRLDVRQSGNTDLVQIYYVQAAALVGFLIKAYGSQDFINFCRQLRDKKNVQEALVFAYPTSVRTLEELEKKWLEYYGGKKK